MSLTAPVDTGRPVIYPAAPLIPLGLCQCGCGGATRIAKETDHRYGHIAHQPVRFLRGHQFRKGSLADRLWPKADMSAGPAACWPWTGYRNPRGYGMIGRGGRYGGMILVHRAAYELTRGPVPPEKPHVLHSCPGGGRPECCNPSHLRAGTHQENMDDMRRQGRERHVPLYGEQNGQAKLTEGQVREIHWLGADIDRSLRTIAQRFGVHQRTVSDILAGRTWAHVEEVHVT